MLGMRQISDLPIEKEDYGVNLLRPGRAKEKSKVEFFRQKILWLVWGNFSIKNLCGALTR